LAAGGFDGAGLALGAAFVFASSTGLPLVFEGAFASGVFSAARFSAEALATGAFDFATGALFLAETAFDVAAAASAFDAEAFSPAPGDFLAVCALFFSAAVFTGAALAAGAGLFFVLSTTLLLLVRVR
jgi:hypothetical protein